MIENIRCFLLDMDGTFYLGDKLLPGAMEFLRILEERKLDFLFLTNNSSKNAIQYVRKLKFYGIHVKQEKILTSGEATAQYINRVYPNANVYLLGTPALMESFRNNRINLTDVSPDLVVLGFDTTLTYEKIRKFCDFVRDGCPYVATHPDINCPTETGFMPDIGSIMALIESSTGRTPDIIIGKPYEQMVQAVLNRTGLVKDEIAMVGDRLYTDIAMGKTGIRTVLVLSGETKREDIKGSGIRPDIVVDDLRGLVKLLEEK